MILLKRGSSGPAVKELQRLLTQCGYGCGNIDGIFGPKTEEAVKNFQRDHGLEADGIAGEKTQDELAFEAAIDRSPDSVTVTRAWLTEMKTFLAMALQDIEKALKGE